MREKILVNLLMKSYAPIKLSQLTLLMELSESTVRNVIKEINISSSNYGFTIELERGKGYCLKVRDKNRFEEYRTNEKKEIDFYNVDQRLEALLFHVLQASEYITIAELMERTCVSRSTILKDLKLVEQKLKEQDLELEKKPHYGIQVSGKEQSFRKAFSKFVLQSNLYLEPTKQYKEFLGKFETENLDDYFRSLLTVNQLNISEVVFENLVTHLKIVLFRASQKNFIKKDQLVMKEIESVYHKAASELSGWIEKEYGLHLPKEEVDFLAAHISAKTSTTTMNIEKMSQLYDDIKTILENLDAEFLTDFYDNEDLIEGLVMHVYPLLNRLYYNLQLENPLINEMKLEYANVFVVAFRFGELIEEKYGHALTRDEIGYIALHLAAHFEKQNQKTLKKVKRIVVICSTGGGSAHLIRLRLERVFPDALVMTISNKNVEAFIEDLPDVFLSTIPLEDEIEGVPVIQIKNFLDDSEIQAIKGKTALHISEREKNKPIVNLQSLFSGKYFRIVETGAYIELISEQANQMIKEDVASEYFADLVMERENKFSTIYNKGIAAPHPLRLEAKTSTIGVTILRNPIEWQGKEVSLIFLINLKQGHLFLHKEISNFLMRLMDNDVARKALLQVHSFDEFLSGFESLL